MNGGLWQSSSIKRSQLFTTNGTFCPPTDVITVYVLLIGGGGGGTSAGPYPGGSGGYVSCGSVNVPGATNINVIVGAGGQSSVGTALFGGSSSFGSNITAIGGQVNGGRNGADGGTGSGYATLMVPS